MLGKLSRNGMVVVGSVPRLPPSELQGTRALLLGLVKQTTAEHHNVWYDEDRLAPTFSWNTDSVVCKYKQIIHLLRGISLHEIRLSILRSNPALTSRLCIKHKGPRLDDPDRLRNISYLHAKRTQCCVDTYIRVHNLSYHNFWPSSCFRVPTRC